MKSSSVARIQGFAAAALLAPLLYDLRYFMQRMPYDEIYAHQGFGTPSLRCNGPRSSWSVMESRFNRSAALEPAFQKSPSKIFDSIRCAAGGEYPFFMYKGPTFGTVCGDEEMKVTEVMLRIFRKHCIRPSKNALCQSRGLMLDVGSNLGYYGLLAMRLGCEALLFDLQPECQKMINNAIIINNFSPMGRTIPFGVSSEAAHFNLSTSGCDGRFPAAAHEDGTFNQGDSVAFVYPLERFVERDQPVLLMKVDTEGNERNVIEGSLHFFRSRLVQNLIVEITPGLGFWENVGLSQLQVAETFRSVAEFGYTVISLVDWSIHDTPEKVFQYVNDASFTQGDLWCTLDAVNSTEINDIAGSCKSGENKTEGFAVGGKGGNIIQMRRNPTFPKHIRP